MPKRHQVEKLLTALGVTGAERERIEELAKHAHEPDWLASGIPGMTEQLAVLLDCERIAEHVTEWSSDLIPGLLQTGDYARTILSDGIEPPEVEAKVALRVSRREALTRAERPLHLTALVGEAAVRYCIGSPTVRNHQLRHLVKMTELETVTIQVVPFSYEWHPGRVGPFILFEFTDDPAIVHLEHHRSGVFLYNEGDVAEYRVLAGRLRERAMSPEDSVKFIAEHIE
ncbi:transcriptional regulator [Saccharothrix coeruleofusca]|uniref:Transcriptional regulator n=1 Tax=Saccharothrix coeruleofusca TaxID=33919 RepID=A0A918EIN5_9PSEU|nr:transcriptional regulator [Saccharothrix coeruleofusca]